MLLARFVLSLALFTAAGCSAARAAATAAPPKPVAQRPTPESPGSPDAVVAVRLPVTYHDVRALSGVLRDLFDVRPDRGDVRAILHDNRDGALIVFATPAGHASVRRVLDRLLASTPA